METNQYEIIQHHTAMIDRKAWPIKLGNLPLDPAMSISHVHSMASHSTA
jgi:hypothetical protein